MEQFLRLKKRRSLRRITEGALLALALAALLTFCAQKERSKVVTTVEVTPFLSYDRMEYTNDHAGGTVISSLALALFAALLCADLICTRVYYTQLDGEDVIIYKGLGPIRLLVGGEEKDVMFFKGYLEAKLKSGVCFTVSPQFFMSFHITFSDGRPAIDL